MVLKYKAYPRGCSNSVVSEGSLRAFKMPSPFSMETAQASYSLVIAMAGCSEVFMTGARSTAYNDFTAKEIRKIIPAQANFLGRPMGDGSDRRNLIRRLSAKLPDARLIIGLWQE